MSSASVNGVRRCAQRVGDEGVLLAILGIIEQFLGERVVLGGGQRRA